eukprot:TRINITY_DN40_c0_g1_i1.p1 TRINITY_DN40_c0_g1~~TRINITY_DN40_c0_g1_i1.p1  ORF type:complete len:275 (-),score=26.48 TRINITY_DN40_c0_g1_i1:18-842(-)
MFSFYLARVPDAPFVLSDFILSTVGVSLAVASANALNQIYEHEQDKLMRRTEKRPIPTKKISIENATTFALLCGGTSALILYNVNTVAMILAIGNILLYRFVYTPLKQMTAWNTWIGALVGAVPPLIGWVSATGSLPSQAYSLFYLLYVWQIPHFLALSWKYRAAYSDAGFVMLSVTQPKQLPSVAFYHSLFLIPFSFMAPYFGLVSWHFCWSSLLWNSILIWDFYQFKKNTSKAFRAFMSSLCNLPGVFVLLLICREPVISTIKQKVLEVLWK